MTVRLLIGPAVLFIAACVVHDPFTSVILAILAVGWYTANEKGSR